MWIMSSVTMIVRSVVTENDYKVSDNDYKVSNN